MSMLKASNRRGGSHADAKIEPPLRQIVERCRLFRTLTGSLSGRTVAPVHKPDLRGTRGQVAEERVVGREETAVADEVVLDDPGVVDANPIRVLDLLEIPHSDAARHALWHIGRKIEQAELHWRTPRSRKQLHQRGMYYVNA